MKLRQGCEVCGSPARKGRRCPRHPLPRRQRRTYSDTAAYRRTVREVLDRDGPVCALCGGPIAGVEPLDAGGWSIDRNVDDPLVLAHVIAHADGGAFTPDNLRPAHRSCNASAGRQPL